MAEKPPKRVRGKAPPLPPRGGGDDEENERPTVNPPFDVEAYARATATSESPGPAAPSPPSADHGADSEFPSDEPRSQQITATNEVELEKARILSAQRSEPPRRFSTGALSIADALTQTTSSVPPRISTPQPSPQPPHQAPSQGSGPPRSLSPSSIEAAVLGAIGSGAAPEITERTIEDPVAEMRERFSLGDYTGALEMSELILAEEPGNAQAAECGANCRSVLENMYAARLGPLERVPLVVVPRAQMRWLSMDHRAGFILSLIDGQSSVDMILDVSGMPKLDALRILHELVQQKIVAFR
jgi:hypothetical protein